MYKKYAKFEAVLYRFEITVATLAFAVIFITVVEQVFQRMFNLPIVDTSDISLVAQGVFSFMCVGLLVYTGGHITIEVHKMIKNEKLLFLVELVMYALLIIISLVFLWLCWDLFLYALSSGSATMALRVPLWIPYGSMFLGICFMIVHSIGAVLKMNYMAKHPEEKEDADDDIESMR